MVSGLLGVAASGGYMSHELEALPEDEYPRRDPEDEIIGVGESDPDSDDELDEDIDELDDEDRDSLDD
jgi:hypothetical protein